MKNKISLISFIILIISTGYAALTLYIWTVFTFGWSVIIGFIILAGFATHSVFKSKEAFYPHLLFSIYFVLIFVYFLIWGFSDWGTAFVGLFIRILTPIFIFANIIPVLYRFVNKRVK